MNFNFQTVLKSEEVVRYSMLDVLNDFAGIISLFLGASFVSSYDLFMEVYKKNLPLFKKPKITT